MAAAADARNGTGRLVTVLGGSGFVGRHVVRALARRGYRVRAAVRRPDLAGHLQPMGVAGQIHAVQANLRYPASLTAAVAGAEAVVNCVGISAGTGEQTFEAVHVDGAEAVARAAREAGVAALVHISALGADPQSSSAYAASKGKGEAAVLEQFPAAIILRPSLIFGPEDELFNRFAAMATSSPALPSVGGGHTRFEPVFVGDVADAVLAAIEGRAKAGQAYELGGPETVTLEEILRRVARYTDRDVKPFPVPFWLAKIIGIASILLPSGLRPITYDQVKMLQVDNVVSEAANAEQRTLAALGITAPTAIEAVVPAYLERFRPRGQFSHYRG
jgi:uncharacterized protein YbjT (DUF2867 family)